MFCFNVVAYQLAALLLLLCCLLFLSGMPAVWNNNKLETYLREHGFLCDIFVVLIKEVERGLPVLGHPLN